MGDADQFDNDAAFADFTNTPGLDLDGADIGAATGFMTQTAAPSYNTTQGQQQQGVDDEWVVVEKQDATTPIAGKAGEPVSAFTAPSAPTAEISSTAHGIATAPQAEPTQPAADLSHDMIDFNAGDDGHSANLGDGGDFSEAIDFGDLPADLQGGYGDNAGDAMDANVSAPAPGGAVEATHSAADNVSAIAPPASEPSKSTEVVQAPSGEQVAATTGAPEGNVPSGEMDVSGDHGQLDFDDSAFGDAFHHTEFEAGDGTGN